MNNIWHPFFPPIIISHPIFKTGVANYVRQRPKRNEIISLADELHKLFLQGRPFMEAVQIFLNICRSVDDTKIKTVGATKKSLAIGVLFQVIAELLVSKVAVTERELETIRQLIERIKTAPLVAWYYPKLVGIRTYAYLKRGTEWLASVINLPSETGQLLQRWNESVGSFEETARQIMQALHEHRKYGVKPAYFEDGITHNSEQVWVIMDPQEIRNPTSDPFGIQTAYTGWFLLTGHDLITSGLAVKQEHQVGAGYTLDQFGSNFAAHLQWFMNKDGELYLTPTGLMPVRDLFVAIDNESGYRVLQLAHILRLYDLTVPLKIVQTLPTLPRRSLNASGKHKFNPLLDPLLIIPRIRELIDGGRDLVDQFDREYKEDEEQTRKRTRKHECVGHARRLPEGHKASAVAKARAEAAGVILEPNETWVKKHDRGSGDLVDRPHKARHRK